MKHFRYPLEACLVRYRKYILVDCTIKSIRQDACQYMLKPSIMTTILNMRKIIFPRYYVLIVCEK